VIPKERDDDKKTGQIIKDKPGSAVNNKYTVWGQSFKYPGKVYSLKNVYTRQDHGPGEK